MAQTNSLHQWDDPWTTEEDDGLLALTPPSCRESESRMISTVHDAAILPKSHVA
jgi:hypothetical protein